MGIKDLNPFLKSHCPGAFITLRTEDFRGKRIAIDAYYWLHNTMSVAAKKIISGSIDPPQRESIVRAWLDQATEFLRSWISKGITPVVIFDGDVLPDKLACTGKRKEKRGTIHEKIQTIQARIAQTDPLGINPEDIRQLRQAHIALTHFSFCDIQALQEILRAMGVPYLEAMFDGEKLCSQLAVEQYVAAVYSRDTDNIPFGTPLLISQVEGNNFLCVRLDTILQELNWSMETLVDFCILCGCDYSIKIYRMGQKKIVELLMEYGSIDNFPQIYDLTPLNHQRCRELFYPIPSGLLVKSSMGRLLDPNSSEVNVILDIQPPSSSGALREILNKYNLREKYSGIMNALTSDAITPAESGGIIL